MSRHDGTQLLQRVWHKTEQDLMLYTVRLAWFLPDAGPVWVRDFGRDDFEFDINFPGVDHA